jgi:Zn-dependent protease with chaperone function
VIAADVASYAAETLEVEVDAATDAGGADLAVTRTGQGAGTAPNGAETAGADPDRVDGDARAADPARRPVERLRASPVGRARLRYEWTVVAAVDRDAVLVHEDVRGPAWYAYGFALAAAALGVVLASVGLVGTDVPVPVPLGGTLLAGVGVVVGTLADLAVTTAARSVLAGADEGVVESAVASYAPAYVALFVCCVLGFGGPVAGAGWAGPVGVAGLMALAVGWLAAGDRALAVARRVDLGARLPVPVGEYLLAVCGAAVPSAGLLVGRAVGPATGRGSLLVLAGGVGLFTAAGILLGPSRDAVAARGLFRRGGPRYAGSPRTGVGLALLAAAAAYASLWVAAAGWATGADWTAAGVVVPGAPGGVPHRSGPLAQSARLAVLAPYGVLLVGMGVGAVSSVAEHRRRFREADPAAFPAADAVDVPVRVTDGDVLDAVAYDDGSRRRLFVPRAAVDLLGPDDDRLRAVLAHEAAHVHEGDARLAVWAPVLAPVVGLGGNVLLAALDFRAREFRADRRAAEATSAGAVADALDALASADAAADDRRVADRIDALTPFLPRATVSTDDRAAGRDGATDGDGETDDDRPLRRWVGRARGAYALLFGGFAATEAHPSPAERTDRLVGERADGTEEPDQ